MEELIFFAIIIFFSILESIARSRKAKQGEVEESSSADGPGRERSRSGTRAGHVGDDLPTYDDDPSYDDLATPEPEGRRPSSETMLPGDLLEQLEGLARSRSPEPDRRQTGTPTEEGRRREEVRRRRQETERKKREARERLEQAEQRRAEAERQRLEARRSGGRDLPAEPSRPLPSLERTEVGSGDVWSGGVGSRAPIGSREHEIHRSHAEYGTDPSSRAPSAEGRIDPFAEPLDAQGVAVRRQLLRGGRKALREAVVVKEVLGQPVALRDEHLGRG